MTSILTNVGAISAVQQMRSLNAARDKSTDEAATGLRVKTAADNTAYWSIATTMRSDNKALAAAGDSLGMGAAAIGVAFSGMSSAIEVVDNIKSKLISAREAGADRNKVNSDITALRAELFSIVDSSSFNGENWLRRASTADDVNPEIVGSFTRDTRGNVSVKTLQYSMTNVIGTNHLVDDIADKGILTSAQYATQTGAATDWVLLNGRKSGTTHTEIALNNATTASDMDEMISVTDGMLMAMTQAAANLGSMISRIEMQSNFVTNLQDTQDRGVGRLVDADLGETSARLRAVQAQNMLATQALSIANATPLNLMPLLQR
jgi:flagellin